ncbi:hypothetical protein F4778DRAFT_762251 [Xylariomycetidae sp. FL2044]|nr:hypothetical protein F4778DRAFT_762251 [Xylariomycetidae sp. FL2044]
MATPRTYTFSCGHDVEDARCVRLWSVILDTGILTAFPATDQVQLPSLPCPDCIEAENYSEGGPSSAPLDFIEQEDLVYGERNAANLAELSHILWALFPLVHEDHETYGSGLVSWSRHMATIISIEDYETKMIPAVMKVFPLDFTLTLLSPAVDGFKPGFEHAFVKARAIYQEVVDAGDKPLPKTWYKGAVSRLDSALSDAFESLRVKATALAEDDSIFQGGNPDEDDTILQLQKQVMEICTRSADLFHEVKNMIPFIEELDSKPRRLLTEEWLYETSLIIDRLVGWCVELRMSVLILEVYKRG